MGAAEAPPVWGLKRRLDEKLPRAGPRRTPTLGQALPMLSMTARLGFFLGDGRGQEIKTSYSWFYMKKKYQKKLPYMDFFKMQEAKHFYGCSLGGIGAGSIGRGFRGEFCRFQLRPGIYEYVTVPEDQFIINIKNEHDNTIFQSVLSAYPKPKKAPASWEWNLNGSDCEYTALYPQAWTTYDLKKYGIMLTCKQISPVIPHNYKDSSLPCGVFVWDVLNVSNEVRKVSVTFTFRSFVDSKTKRRDEILNFERYSDNHTCGVSMEQKIGDMPCTFIVAKKKQATDSTTDGFCKFNAKKTSASVWSTIDSRGRLMPNDVPAGKYNPDAMGLSSQIVLAAGGRDKLEFCLVWDMPLVHFGNNTQKYNRYYTNYFGKDGIAGTSIACYALITYKKWEQEIKDWQKPILDDPNLPNWYKSALMNELYYIADGGTIWLDGSDQYPKDDPRGLYGIFGYLEGHEYRMYNTYDVHFYASFALALLWPHLQVSLQYQFKDSILGEMKNRRKQLADGSKCARKVINSVPHDLGDPEEDPFILCNAYHIHDVSEWRDLNLKFILQVFRDITVLKSLKQKRDNLDRYHSLEYIDEDADEEEDLYVRSTNQDIEEVFNLNSNATPAKTRPSNGFCRNSESEVIAPKPGSRIKYISISSNDYMEDDLTYMKHPGVARQNSNPFVLNSQVSQYSEVMAEYEHDMFDPDKYLRDMYPVCRKLIDTVMPWDTDKDGLIENTGSPDQTFDAWTMTGPSAYCGGLWLAALQCMIAMATTLNHQDDVAMLKSILDKGRVAFDAKLWNGSFYNFDSRSKVIMADQLCGHWYLRACGFHYSVFPKDKVESAIATILNFNVKHFGGGTMGAVNGYIPPIGDKLGRIDRSSIQSEECWPGVTYGLAALMIHENMSDRAFEMAGGMYETLNKKLGMSFETPEAIYESGTYRSIGYMRPLAIWAMQHALNSTTLVDGKVR